MWPRCRTTSRRSSPYYFPDRLFKVEKEGSFYGISAKRYVVYELEEGRPKIIDYKSHGWDTSPIPIHRTARMANGPSRPRQVSEDILMEHYRMSGGGRDFGEISGSLRRIQAGHHHPQPPGPLPSVMNRELRTQDDQALQFHASGGGEHRRQEDERRR